MKSRINIEPAIKQTAAPTRAFHLFLPLLFLYGTAAAQGDLPQILSQPTNQSALFFGSAVFSVTVSSSLPVSYQWVFNGEPIANATNADLVLGLLNCGQSGYYNVIVSNAAGALSSAKAQLTVYQTVVSSTGSSFGQAAQVQDFLLQFTNVMVTAGGYSYTSIYALTSDGTLADYVPYPAEQSPDVPPGLSGFVAISSGDYDLLALTGEGTVAAWDYQGGISVPSSLSNVLAVAASYPYSVALQSNGTVVVMSASGSTYAQSSPPLSNIVAIAAGEESAYALSANGAVYEWEPGENQVQLVAGLSNVIAIAATSGPLFALEADGTLVNASGVNLLPNVSNVVAMAPSMYSSTSFLALKSDGTLATSANSPSFPFALSNVFAIALSPALNGIALISNGAPVFTVQPGNQTWTNGGTIWLHARAVGVQPMSYQWQLNGTDIPDATNADLTITNAQGEDSGQYCALASNNLGSAASRLAIVTIPGFAPYTLAQALGATNLPWFTFGDAEWFPEVTISEDGIAAAQSGRITNSMYTELQTLVTGPGTLTFWWKVSSEEFFDFLSFYIGSDTNYAARISGEVDWEQETFAIGPGTQPLSWIYAKDPDISVGQDAGWLDQVSFVPTSPQTNHYTLGTSALLVGPSAGINSVVLALAPPSGAWSATTSTPWLHLTAANQNGAGSTNVFFSYDANPGVTRLGTLSIGGQTLTVTQAGSAYVPAGSVTALVSSGIGEPWQVALDAAGNVYFAAPSNTVQKWTAANNAVSTVISSGLSDPVGLAVDNQGNVYIADDGPYALYEWKAATSNLITLVSNGVYSGGNNLAVDAAGNVYIDTGSIYKWTAADATFAPLSNAPSAESLAVDIAGNVYCSVYPSWQIEELIAADNLSIPLSFAVSNPPLRQTFGLAVDGAGNVYLADTQYGAIQKWTAATQALTTLFTEDAGSVISVAVDGTGNVYFSVRVSNGDQQGLIDELPYAFVDPTPKLEGPAAGADSLPVVLPSTENLLPPFAPASDQSWLTITGSTNGVVSFSFTANAGPNRTANISLLGQTIPITQEAIGSPLTLTGAHILGRGVLQLAFSNSSGASFTVLSTTNLALPLSQWTVAGPATNTGAGQYQFTSQPTPNDPQRYYLIRSP
jgi:sugar lactone lactonase YvrE